MDIHQIERYLREGPPDEPVYAGRTFRPPAEVSSMTVARAVVRAAGPSPATVLVGLLLVGLALAGFLRVGQPTGPGGLPGRVASTPSPTPSISSPPSPSPNDCTAERLHLEVRSVEGAAGSRILNFTLSNDGPMSCELIVSRAAIVDRATSPATTLVEARPSPAPTAQVAAGATVDGAARWSNQCGAAPGGPLFLTLDVMAGTTVSGSVPSDPALAVPPCLGSGGPALEVRFGT